GLAGFLELASIQEMAHEVETLLDEARNGQLQITPKVIDVVLAGADYLRESIDCVEGSLHGSSRAAPADRGVVAGIRRLLEGEADEPVQLQTAVPSVQSEAKVEVKAVKVDTGKLDYLADMAGEMVIAQALVLHDPDLATVKSARLARNLSHLT